MRYFLHIPKTAGTTLASVLVTGLAQQGKSMLGPCLLDDLLRPENVDFRDRDLVFGHLGPALVPEAVETFTVLREPRAHIRSWYEHVCREPGHYFHPIAKEEKISFLDWLSDPRFGCLARNPQARHLGMPCCIPDGEFCATAPWFHQRAYETSDVVMSDAELLAGARETLDACALVGTTDGLDRFVTAISARLGFSAPPTVPHLNTAASSRGVHPSQEEIRALDRCTELDALLYQEAQRRSQPRLMERLFARARF